MAESIEKDESSVSHAVSKAVNDYIKALSDESRMLVVLKSQLRITYAR